MQDSGFIVTDMTEKRLIELATAKKILVTIGLRPLHDYGILSFTSSDDKPLPIECRLEEYEIGGFTYKINLKHDVPGYAERHIYTTDLVSLIRDGRVTYRELE